MAPPEFEDQAELLDSEQRAAVESNEPVIAVLAGPGSGKTRVLSFRAQRLLIDNPGSRALLLTFTNKAAAEMKARALGIAAVTSDRIQASTFHTFGMCLLRAHGDLLEIDRDFEILDRDEQDGFAKRVAREVGVPDRKSRWGYLRLRQEEVRESSVASFGAAYEESKRDACVLDFDDLIVCTADLFEQHPDVAEAYATRFPHLLVDEFQDTNAAQFAIIRALSERAATVGVFADDDQAIYRFAGAEAKNIRRFISQLGAQEYSLTFNYRCHEAIIDRANRLILADPEASGRQMRAVHEAGEVEHFVFEDEESEAEFVASEVASLIEDESVRPADIAVLARAAWRATPALRELERANVSTSNWLGESYEPLERQALAAGLCVVRGRLNDRQARRLCKLLEVEDPGERDVDAFLEQCAGAPGVDELFLLREMAYQGATVSAIVRQAQSCVVAVHPELHKAMAAVVEDVQSFEQHDPEFTLEHLLSDLALGGVGGAPTATGGVKVASLHRTKGLQWPRVYIVGLEDGTLPNYRAETESARSEERRACFVGVCRAETHLTLTRVTQYRGHLKRPSIFLEEMGIDPYG